MTLNGQCEGMSGMGGVIVLEMTRGWVVRCVCVKVCVWWALPQLEVVCVG